jgi:CheY-like chemotaxis protein
MFAEPMPPKPRLRILVVDDNPDSAMSLAMVLSMMGHETRTAHDGETAVSTAEAFRPRVVLLDIGLPKLNGYEVAQRIRQEAWGESMFLVAVTGWGQDEDRQRSEDVGMNLHLVKPVEPAALDRVLSGL